MLQSADQKKAGLWERDLAVGGVNLIQKALFAKHLAVMLRSGIPLNEALIISRDSSRGKMRKVLGKVSASVQSGRSLADSFGDAPKVFSALFVNITKAGELSGNLDGNLENVAEQLKKEHNLRAKILGALIYPAVVLGASFLLGLAMAFLVLPKITPLFEGLKIDLPLTTRFLIWFSHVIQNYGIYLFGGIIVFIGLCVWLFRQKFFKPVLHWFFLKVPIVKKISAASNLARFCRGLGTLLRSGLNIDEASRITYETVGNFYYRRALQKVSEDIVKGTKLSENLELFGQHFPLLMTRMIRVGEESGKMDETLLYLAEFYEEEVDNSTKSLATAIEPLLLIFIGIVVAFLALSIITPIYNITGGIKK